MVRAFWKGVLIAESDETVVVEGNHYFPRKDVNRDYLRESATHTTCSWKGEASYYDLVIDGAVNSDAAWYYPDPKEVAHQIQDRIAFWKGVEVH